LYDRILSTNGLPIALKYLSVIEIHLQPNLVSWAGAVGPWQLMPYEARRFGLKNNAAVDERTNFTKSTIVAAK
jgi:membrane-bound lytic murein transglycosylase D